MNYLLKRQATPGVVDCFLNNTKQSNIMSCYCHNCLRLHPVLCNNVPKLCSSSYVAALQESLKGQPKNENNSKKTIDDSKKLTEMLKVIPFKNSKKKQFVSKNQFEISKSGQLAWKNKYAVGSSKSFDPNILTYNVEVDRFYTEYPKPKNFNPNKQILKPGKFPLQDVDAKKSYINRFQQNSENPDIKSALFTYEDETVRKSPAYNLMQSIEHHKFEKPFHELVVQSKTHEDAKFFQTFSVPVNEDTVMINFLSSSLDICFTNDMVMKGFQMLQMYRKKNAWRRIVEIKKPAVIHIYNPLLRALAYKGHWYLIQAVDQWMVYENVKLTPESFAAYLLCLANVKEDEKEELLRREISAVLNKIFLNNISLNDIFTKTKLYKEDYEKILSVIRMVIPAFEVEPVVLELNSNCTLLKNLYTGVKGGLNKLQPQLENWGEDAIDDAVAQQSAAEKNFSVSVKAVSSGRSDVKSEAKYKPVIDKLKSDWRKSLTQAFSVHQKKTSEELTKIPLWSDIHLYLNSLPAESFVDIMMETTLKIIEYTGNYTPCCDEFRRNIGLTVFQRYQQRKNEITGYTRKTEELVKKYMSWYFKPSGPAMNCRQKWQMLLQDSEKYGYFGSDIVKWPQVVHTKVGKFLLDLIIKTVTFPVKTKTGIQSRPVFYSVVRFRDGLYRLELKCHPMVTHMFEAVGFDILHFRAAEVPMLCPPKPWKSSQNGGYLFLPSEFIRKPGSIEGKKLLYDDIPEKQLYAAMDSLNAIQSVPWIINEQVLDVALEVFKTGGSEKLSVPMLPQKLPPYKKPSEELNFKLRVQEYLKRKELVKKYANNYSLWCEHLYRLSLANHFRKKVFWLPQNFDFRGRVYPIPPLVSYLGSDLFRSLFVFAKGKPLGPKGLDWLKIHLINLTGSQKKMSVDYRLKYANEILPEILDSAENPLAGKKWWMKSDEPWQTLAACMEVKKALSVSDPESYVCGFPVHQDGSCNGLQHYAALGKDLVGAKSVNLLPCDVPQDVYTVVANLVEEERAKDAELGVEIAKILEGFIDRKLVKQTVMTTVYGVTNYGAKLQVAKRLEEIPNFPKEYVGRAAAYVAGKTFFSLRQMFTSAKQIQDWFINCASEICKMKDYVQWISPIGLPVVQPYGKYVTDKTSDLKIIVPDSMKQKNAFPPNFIHSLDSCHMMLTALYCEQEGITFSAVHDCFWTHPNCVDRMNRICREQFISLYNQSILENLSVFFKKTYLNDSSKNATEVFTAVPEKGDFNVNEVSKSVYFFS